MRNPRILLRLLVHPTRIISSNNFRVLFKSHRPHHPYVKFFYRSNKSNHAINAAPLYQLHYLFLRGRVTQHLDEHDTKLFAQELKYIVIVSEPPNIIERKVCMPGEEDEQDPGDELFDWETYMSQNDCLDGLSDRSHHHPVVDEYRSEQIHVRMPIAQATDL